MRSLELGTAGSLEVALLGLLEVDDVPDGVEVLHMKQSGELKARERDVEEYVRQP